MTKTQREERRRADSIDELRRSIAAAVPEPTETTTPAHPFSLFTPADCIDPSGFLRWGAYWRTSK